MTRWTLAAAIGLIGGAVWAEEGEATASTPAADVLQVKWHDVKATKQVKPSVPPFAKIALPTKCKIQFTIDEAGIPSLIQIEECPEKLKPNAEKAANKWRFEPVMRHGQAQKAAFTVILNIKR